MEKVVVSTSGLTASDVIAVARHNAQIEISAESLAAMAETREHIERLAVSEEPVYGISTGVLEHLRSVTFLWRIVFSCRSL